MVNLLKESTGRKDDPFLLESLLNFLLQMRVGVTDRWELCGVVFSLAQLKAKPQLGCCFPSPSFVLRGTGNSIISLPYSPPGTPGQHFIFTSSTEQLRSLTRDRDSSCCTPGGKMCGQTHGLSSGITKLVKHSLGSR